MNLTNVSVEGLLSIALFTVISAEISDTMEFRMLVRDKAGKELVVKFSPEESQIIIGACVDLVSAIIFPEGGE